VLESVCHQPNSLNTNLSQSVLKVKTLTVYIDESAIKIYKCLVFLNVCMVASRDVHLF
jgi:hypothetical protein